MAGLEQLQFQDYERNMPEGAKLSLAPLNALYSGGQQRNIARQQELQLQSNQAQTLEDTLRGNVAQLQNTPQGLQTLAGGAQGVAQGQAAAGQVAQAEAPAKVTQAQIDLTMKKFERAQQQFQTNPAAGLASIDDPEVRQAITVGMQAHPGEHPSKIVDTILTGVSALKNKQLQDEAMAKKAPEIQIARDHDAALVKAGAGHDMARVEAANIRAVLQEHREAARAVLRGSDTPKALDADYLRESAKIATARSKAIAATEMTPELDQALKDQAILLRADYEEIRAKYKTALPATGAAPKDVALKLKLGFAASPDQEKSIANAIAAIQKRPEIRGEVVKRLREAGIQIEE